MSEQISSSKVDITCEKIQINLTGHIYIYIPKSYLYKPKEDITAYELSLITPILLFSHLGNSNIEQLIKNLPENAQRHFEEEK